MVRVRYRRIFHPNVLFFLFWLLALQACPATATDSIDPVVTPWQFYFNRCNTYQGPYDAEDDAVEIGAESYYGIVCPGSTWVENPRFWGTPEQPTNGACGSTRHYPRYPGGFSAIENDNTRHYSIGYNLGQSCNSSTQDGLTLRRQRSVSCPPGFSTNGVDKCVRAEDVERSLGSCPAPAAGGGPAGPFSSLFQGNPINIATGNKFERELDYSGSGPNPLEFVRYYNSPAAVSAGSLGAHWRMSYDRKLAITDGGFATPSLVKALRPDGKAYTFFKSGGALEFDSDVDYELTMQGDEFLLTLPDDFQDLYSVDGLLLEIRSRSGHTQTMVYDASNRLGQVNGFFGRSISFEYDANGLLSAFIDPAGNRYEYQYDASQRLTRVVYPDATPGDSNDNPDREYLYENASFSHALTGLIDENGDRFATWAYDSQGRAISSEQGNGANATIISWAPGGMSATVTRASGQQSTFTFDDLLVDARARNLPMGFLCLLKAPAPERRAGRPR